MRLPETVMGPRLTLRRWRPADAPVLGRAVEESLDHLRPWMSWAADEPLSLPARAALLRTFESNWRRGSEVVLGAFVDGAVVGGCGLVHRSLPSVLEIGYWVHVDHLRRGYATEMASSLTDAAFSLDGVERVEIHHDRANVRSGAVPASLGFTYDGARPDEVMAPAEEGTDCTWIMLRPQWVRRHRHREDDRP